LDETLKEYLVKIGWDVDNISFQNANEQINKFNRLAELSAKSLGMAFTSAGSLIFDTIFSITESMWSLVSSTAEADLRVETFARRMWTTEQNARSLTTALDALGMEYNDLFYTTEEQFRRFLSLNALGKTLEAPAELDETLVKVRNIQFEISKMKMIFQYASRWVVYYLGEMFGDDLDSAQQKLSNFNNFLIEKIPKFTKVIAEFFGVFYRLVRSVIWALEGIGSAAVSSFGNLETSGVSALMTIATVATLVSKGPLGIFLLVLGLILLLLEDFMVWQKGGKSLFDWSSVSNMLGNMEGKLDDTADRFQTLIDKVDKFFKMFHLNEAAMLFVETFFQALEVALDGTNIAMDLLIGLFDILLGDFESLANNKLFQDINSLLDTLFGEGFTSNFKDNFIGGFTWEPPDILKNLFGINDPNTKMTATGVLPSSGRSQNTTNNTNTQNNNVTNNFYGETTDGQVDRISGSISKFRMWTPRT
jgi:hypothetical protein